MNPPENFQLSRKSYSSRPLDPLSHHRDSPSNQRDPPSHHPDLPSHHSDPLILPPRARQLLPLFPDSTVHPAAPRKHQSQGHQSLDGEETDEPFIDLMSFLAQNIASVALWVVSIRILQWC